MKKRTWNKLLYLVLYIVAVYSLLNFYFFQSNLKKIFGILGHIILIYFLFYHYFRARSKG